MHEPQQKHDFSIDSKVESLTSRRGINTLKGTPNAGKRTTSTTVVSPQTELYKQSNKKVCIKEFCNVPDTDENKMYRFLKTRMF